MQEPSIEKTRCHGCGAVVANIPGQPHKYIGALQGCWDLYVQVLAREYGEYSHLEDTHRLTVDTYAIQHPGQPGRQSIRSVNLHLISLYLVLAENLRGGQATKMIGRILERCPRFEWLAPPVPNGRMTVADALGAANRQEHAAVVRQWARDVFGCWFAMHRQTIEGMVAENT